MFKIFVSHSSSDSPLVNALRNLICDAFVEEVELMYSSASVASGGIDAGQSWLDWIHTQIRQSAVTIVILTPFSKARPWLLWEAGAVTGVGLSQGASKPVVPLLFGINNEEVPSPLRGHQLKFGTVEGDIKDLLESLRRAGKLHFKTNTHVQALVTSYIEAVTIIRVPGMYDLFISCPMTSLKEEEFNQLRSIIDSMFECISTKGYSIYCSIRKNRDRRVLDPEAIAAEGDLAALRASRNFLMIYPRKCLSSCLLEAGYALISGMQSTYFVRHDYDLPYMMRGALESFDNVKCFRFREQREISDLFSRYQSQIIT
jgi:hypothetical protein